MNSRALVDPELLPLLEVFPTGDWSGETLAATRQRLIEGSKATQPVPPSVRLEVKHVAATDPDRSIEVRLFRPSCVQGKLPVYLHMHGGGYVAGIARGSDGRNAQIAERTRCLVASVEYRLAPEAPYPAALEDCYTVLHWLRDQADALGIGAARLAVGGESAGAGLAAALALRLRDEGDVRPLLQLLTFPMLDDRTVGLTPTPNSGEFVWTEASNRFGWQCYLGSEDDADRIDHRYAAPGRATHLEGLPPAFIATGSLDLFARENVDYAARLLEVGVEVELHLYPGAFHGFNLSPTATVAQAYRDAADAALKRAFQHPNADQ